jgi:ComF family protein
MSIARQCTRLLRLSLPQCCALCTAASGDALLCAACIADMPRTPDACPTCATPTAGGLRCGTCLATPPPQSATVAAWRYSFPVDHLLHAFKYRHHLALADPFSDAIVAAVIARGEPLPDCIVALPLAKARQRARGFNQSQEIARRIAAELGLRCASVLRRVRDTPPQAGLKLDARTRNVRGAFEADASIAGQRVAIVDDVMTTGATLMEAAKVLRRMRALRVDAWVVARTPPPGDAMHNVALR